MNNPSQNTVKDVKVALSKTRSLLIVLPELITLDTAVAAKLLVELLAKSLNKPARLLLPKEHTLPNRVADFLGYTQFDKELVVNQVLPLKYTMSLPNVEEGTEVEWKLEKETLEVTLKPKSGKVDFSKLAFGAEGERYDSLISLGAQAKAMLNSAYQDSAIAVEEIALINLDCHPRNENFGGVNVVDTKASTVTEVVFELYKSLGVKVSKDNADLAKKTVVVSTDGLRRIASSETLVRLVELEKLADNNVSEVVRTHYHSLGKKGLALREIMLKNAKLEQDSHVLWSHISAEELNSLEIDASVLDGIEQLPYNICKDVKVAALLYQTASSWRAVAIADDRQISLFHWAKSLGGKATASIGMAELKGDLDTVSKTMLKSLGQEALGKASIEGTGESVTAPASEEAPKEEPAKNLSVQNSSTRSGANSSSPFTKASDEQVKTLVQESQGNIPTSTSTMLQAQKAPFEKDKKFDGPN